MAFTINKPKTIATEQRFEFTNMTINRSGKGELSAQISFNIINEFEVVISSESLFYAGEDFNTFWENFNSGTFLYEEIAKKYNESKITSQESDFVNTPTESENLGN